MASGTVNPTNIVGYSFDTNPFHIPAASANGPGASVEIKFGESREGGISGVICNKGDNWLTFAGFYYLYNVNPQGETIPFKDFKDVSGSQGTC